MVKNLPTVERSTKIRFGKNCAEDQGENTIVFNASNVEFDATQPGSVYISPLRQVLDVSDRQIKILTYNRISKEVTDSGVAAVDVLQPNFQATTNLGNTTTNTIEFRNPETGFVTTANVGIANTLASHTLSVGSNLYVDDVASNVLVVNGNTNINGDIVVQGNAQIDGVLTVINTENLTITDAIIELGRNNTVGDATTDLGIVMNRPGSNDTVGFLEGTDELALAYTETSAESKTITPLTSETLDVHVYGRVLTESNVGIINTSPIHTLDVGSNLFVDEYGSNVLVVSGNASISGDLTVDEDTFHVDVGGESIGLGTVTPDANLHVIGNVYVSSNLTVDENTLHVDATTNSVGIETKNPQANLHVVGNVYVSSNLTVDENTFHVDAVNHAVGIETKSPDANLHVVGNVYVSSNLTVDEDTFHVDTTTHSVGVETKNPSANLHVVGNVYVSSNLTIDEDTFHVDATTNSVGIETKNPQANLHVVGNTYISDDLTVATDTFHVDATTERVGIKTKTQDAELHVVGNAYVSSNLTVDEDTLHVDATTNSVGIETKNPQANLHVVGNVYVSSNLTVDEDTLHVDTTTHSVGVETNSPDANLHVVGNVYVSSNLTVDEDTFHVDATTNSVGIGTVNPSANLHVVGNVYVSSNITTDGTLTLNHPTTALITDLTANVEVKLNQLANVTIDTTTLANEDMLVYDGSNWVNQLQNHTFLYAKAEETIDKGDAVYATGTIGNNMFSIQKAQANSSATMPALGVAYQDFALNQEGLIVTFGRADGINTDNFQTGETVYVSNVTAGALSNVKPYGATDLIQNIGLVVKGHPSTGIVSVTGVGRSNDIPNAPIETSNASVNYVYVNSENNDLRKIDPMKLPTKFQTLAQVVNTGNTVSNTINVTGLTTTGNVNVTSNISVAGLIDPNNKYLPMVDTNGYFVKSPVYVTNEGKYVISASEAEFLCNITLGGNTTIISSTSVTIEDRIFGVGANNSATGLDSGFMIEHQDDGTFANVALIHHADEHRFSIGYTQNTFTDNHILYKQHDDGTLLRIELHGNLIVQNNLSVSETGTFDGRVGVKTVSPGYDLDVWGTANVGVLTATTVSAENVKGTVVTGSTLYGTIEGSNTASFSTLYGTIGGSNTASVSDLTASGTIKGAAVTGTTLYGTLSGSNTASVSTLTASGTVKGATLTGTNLYGTLSGSNTASVSTLTASGTVKGATLTGTNLYGTLAGSNTASVSDLTASGTIKGAAVTGTTLYGTLAGSNTASVSDLTASGTVKGATLTGTNLYGTLAGSNTASVSDLTASGTVKGATLTGTNLYGTLSGSNTASVSTLTVGGTTQATSTTTGALTVAGGISTQTNVHAANVYISGGLITNTAGVTRKTYAYSGTIGDTEQPHINVCFTNESFSAKIDAQLIEGDDEISVISLVCCGGNKSGTFPASDIKTGSVQVFGPASTNAWNVAVVTDKTTVALRPFGALEGAGEYHIFVEYTTAKTAGAVANVVQDTTEKVVFGY